MLTNRVKRSLPAIAVILFIIMFYIFFAIQFDSRDKENCQLLIKTIQSSKKQKELELFAKHFMTIDKIGYNGPESGVLEYIDFKDKNIYNKELLPFHEGLVGMEIVGTNINYTDLSQSNIESVLVGMTSRKYILIDIDNNGNFGEKSKNIQQSEIKYHTGIFKAVCRSSQY